jgi:hypothetical protein
MKGRVIHNPTADLFAQNSVTTAQWISAKLASCVARCLQVSQPIVLMHLATNDPRTSVAIGTTKANIQTIVAALNAAGARVLWLLEHPCSGGFAFGGSNNQVKNQLNAWLIDLANSGTYKLMTVNYLDEFLDASTGLVISGYQRDGLHDAQIGAEVKANAVERALNVLVPKSVMMPFIDSTDVFDSSANPMGNKLTNGLLAGTGGTVTSPATGTSPTSWTLAVRNAANSGAGSTLTAAGANVSHASGLGGIDDYAITGLTGLKVTLGGTAGSGEFVRLTQSPSVTNYSAGDVIRMRAWVNWTGVSNIASIYLNTVVNSPTVTIIDGIQGSSGGNVPAAGTRMFEVYVTLPASLTGTFVFELRIVAATNTSAVAGEVTWWRPEIRKLVA